jgi:predicted  nucleic acid-binding Zn-ribbon protein
VAADQAREQGAIDTLEQDLNAARQARDEVLAGVEQARTERSSRRAEVTAALDADLLGLYERQRTTSGIGAGRLLGGRCGACRIELDRGELARISAAPEDDVLRCQECGAILLRLKVSGE